MFQRGQLRLQAGQRITAVVALAVVAILGDGQQQLWLDLLEAFQHALAAEFGRAAGPDGADAAGGEQGDDRLGDVGQVSDDAVAPPDAQFAQAGGESGDLARGVGPAEGMERAALVGIKQHRVTFMTFGEDILGIIERAAGEPTRAGHLTGGERRLPTVVMAQIAEGEEALPESGQILYGPTMQRAVIGKSEVALP